MLCAGAARCNAEGRAPGGGVAESPQGVKHNHKNDNNNNNNNNKKKKKNRKKTKLTNNNNNNDNQARPRRG